MLHLHMDESDRDKALEALAISRELERKDWVAAWLGNLAILDKDQGAYKQAVAGFEESIRLNNEVGNYRGAALQLSNLGDCYRAMGRHDDARLALEKALATNTRLGNTNIMSYTHYHLGQLNEVLKNYRAALEHDDQTLTIWRKQGNPEHIKGAEANITHVRRKINGG